MRITDIAGPTVSAVFGLLLIRLAMLGEHTSYVKASLGPWLLLTGAFFLFVGLWSLVAQVRDARAGRSAHFPRVAWLLLLPVLVVALLNPSPLGAYSASAAVAGQAPGTRVAPLPEGSDVVSMRADDYVIRTMFNDPMPMRGRRFRIVGFVSHPNGPTADWDLARLKIMCCASDAGVYRITAQGAPPLPDNTWVEVIGEYAPATQEAAVLRIESVNPVQAPENPYL